MASGLVVPLSLNPKEWLRGIRLVEDSLEDVEDSLGEVEKEGDNLESELTKNFKDATGDAEDAFSKFSRSARDDLGRIEDSADDVEREIGDMEDEANQSAKEFGASFRGDPLEALEEVQSYISEIASQKFGGLIGGFAAIAGGAAIGLVIKAVEMWKERQEAIKEQAASILDLYKEAGFVLDENLKKQVAEQVLEENSMEDNLELLRLATERGQTIQDLVEDMLYGNEVQEEYRALLDEENQLKQELAELGIIDTEEEQRKADIINGQLLVLDDQIGKYATALDIMKQEEDSMALVNKYTLEMSANTAAVAGNVEDTVISSGNIKDPGMKKTKDDAKTVDTTLRNLPGSHTMRIHFTGQNSQDQRLLDKGTAG